MTLIDAALLGLVQGLTEFLPVSSSGHLVLIEHWMAISSPGVTFEVAVHIGTLFSILIMLRKDIRALVDSTLCIVGIRRDAKTSPRLCGLVLLGIAPAGVAGVLLKDFFKSFFNNPEAVGMFLILTGTVLIGTRYIRPPRGELTIFRVLVIGFVQILAIFPGVSRSGSTIAAGMFAGVKPDTAVTYSFLMAVPLLAGASVLEGIDLLSAPPSWDAVFTLLLGMVVSCLAGCGAIAWLLRALRRGQFSLFGYYCCTVGLMTALLLV